ncbi:LytR/AlgR family response regulator transcription factor [Alteromonas oceanisediminis]|uniref:LytR/AlgR family response regulator transcription factor n=1 Tax=Alteromonas oceanisediminis TaxID=2836180 RepID=UPI001BD92D6E|nr:LytTR family DNA-binding domain-containing protein [Alteromonas oceanisediminis]MBT0585896.1 LytTR family DNA-binding domain-containing protein [Alteromonas oceanisediminis]
MLSVLIADDEPLARECVAVMLQKEPKIDQILQAGSGIEALNIIRQYPIDLAFLDIQMPGMSGLSLAQQLPKSCVRIFVTAFDQFALPAFEVNAVDYLLKPFSDERFSQALARAFEALSLSAAPPNNVTYRSRLIVRDPGRIRLVDVDSINFIKGAGNYVELHMNNGKTVLHRETMASLERQLDPDVFVRIHRSSMVRRTCVTELRPNDKGDYTVILASGENLTLSRRNRDKIDALTS